MGVLQYHGLSLLIAALLSGLLYYGAKLIIKSDTPIESGRRYIPMYAGLVGFIISAITLNKSLKNTDVSELITTTFGGSDLIVVNILISLSVALVCYAISD